jgi:hypothetical protein
VGKRDGMTQRLIISNTDEHCGRGREATRQKNKQANTGTGPRVHMFKFGTCRTFFHSPTELRPGAGNWPSTTMDGYETTYLLHYCRLNLNDLGTRLHDITR